MVRAIMHRPSGAAEHVRRCPWGANEVGEALFHFHFMVPPCFSLRATKGRHGGEEWRTGRDSNPVKAVFRCFQFWNSLILRTSSKLAKGRYWRCGGTFEVSNRPVQTMPWLHLCPWHRCKISSLRLRCSRLPWRFVPVRRWRPGRK